MRWLILKEFGNRFRKHIKVFILCFVAYFIGFFSNKGATTHLKRLYTSNGSLKGHKTSVGESEVVIDRITTDHVKKTITKEKIRYKDSKSIASSYKKDQKFKKQHEKIVYKSTGIGFLYNYKNYRDSEIFLTQKIPFFNNVDIAASTDLKFKTYKVGLEMRF